MPGDTQRKERIEITSSVDSHFQVPVVLHGKARSIPLRLLLDTGASNVVIPTWVASALGLEIGEEEVVETAMGSMRLRTTNVPRIQVRGSDLWARNVPCWITNNLLLGMSFLRNFKFHVEYGRKLVIEK